MAEIIFHKVVQDLEVLTCNQISLPRALDLLEASTQRIDEIIAINTMRETLKEEE